MRASLPYARVLSAAVLATTMVAATSGCSWFHKGKPRGDYALAPEMRPLEVPPDLTAPDTSGAMKVPALASATQRPAAAAPGQAPVASNSGFVVPGARDHVFGQVGDALGAIEGVTIASRAQVLGSYDVAYAGSNFLVRVVAVDAGVYVSTVDPRGLPATGDAPVKLIAMLKAKLGY
ncbi:hypothetical protein [Xanthomonas theicola]|uniref:Beta-barrel assembly machine subunit BamC n=1 Tax=Xanthomonas theicola TaxID=56464 RepID=A0A2S6ZLN3_9XANT|nr:hypothetical protein [Xanthomonas theicola]PPT93192.1 hypothetical protein XthCFBP4691_00795 [Xanthomonas theicola]QNH25013.1 hypothetical protein G4Q83_10055 [Xanthomonas theicola]